MSCNRRIDLSMLAVRGDLGLQVTFCPLMCLGIIADPCVSIELWRKDPVELNIEEQFSDDVCPNFKADA